jgi:superfamily II DNA or RNA helicase
MASKAAALRRGDIVRIRAARWRITGYTPHGETAFIDAAGCDHTNRADRARFLVPFEPLERVHMPDAPQVVRPARWRHVARHALADAHPSWASLRTAARANLTPIPYQLEPALALQRGDACRFLIADAVGLGKTVQAALMIAETLERRPDAKIMVVSPAALREQWQQELHRRFNLDATVLDAARLAASARQLPAQVNPWSTQAIVITSIDYVKRPEVIRALETLIWDIAVFDEAHNLTGRSDRASAAGLLAARARVVVLLTATPHSGSDEAFNRLCGLGRLAPDEPMAVFRRTRSEAGRAGTSRSVLLRVRPTDEEAAMHDLLMAYAQRVWREAPGTTLAGGRLAACVLTRRGCSSAAALARSVERRIALLSDGPVAGSVQASLPFENHADADDEPHWQLGSRGFADLSEERVWLNRLLAQARKAATRESKIAALRRLLSRAGEPAIVFTEYRDTLQRLADELGDIQPLQLHGGLTWRERAAVLREFTEGAARLLLATDAGSEGLNLHHRCRRIINLELPWTPLRLEQRAGRVDRIGQTCRVHVTHLVAAATCEDTLLARLTSRVQHQHAVLNLLSTAPEERSIAASILGRTTIPAAESSVTVPDDLMVLDLRPEAQVESLRIERARQLIAIERNPPGASRPVLTTIVRRRARFARRQCLWLFKVVYVSATGRLLWESLVPLQAEPRSVISTAPHVTRCVLDPRRPAVQRVLHDARYERLRGLRLSLERPLRLWRDREWKLIDRLRSGDARLSSALLQPGLFDRRAEQLAASQASLLNAALLQSDDHLAALAASEHPHMDGCELAFGVVLG